MENSLIRVSRAAKQLFGIGNTPAPDPAHSLIVPSRSAPLLGGTSPLLALLFLFLGLRLLSQDVVTDSFTGPRDSSKWSDTEVVSGRYLRMDDSNGAFGNQLSLYTVPESTTRGNQSGDIRRRWLRHRMTPNLDTTVEIEMTSSNPIFNIAGENGWMDVYLAAIDRSNPARLCSIGFFHEKRSFQSPRKYWFANQDGTVLRNTETSLNSGTLILQWNSQTRTMRWATRALDGTVLEMATRQVDWLAAGNEADLFIGYYSGINRSLTVLAIEVSPSTPFLFDNWRITNSTPVILPSISRQPASVETVVGRAALFQVTASGSTPLTYRWQRRSFGQSAWSDLTEGQGHAGVGTVSLAFQSPAQSQNGDAYRVIVSNTAGSATSDPAFLTVIVPPPVAMITTQPVSISAVVGTSAGFSVQATGSGLTYRWQRRGSGEGTWSDVFNTEPYSGASGPDLVISPVSTGNNGDSYRVRITNAGGAVESSAAVLTVLAVAPPRVEAQPVSVSVVVDQRISRATVG
jgi:hypothetical protein